MSSMRVRPTTMGLHLTPIQASLARRSRSLPCRLVSATPSQTALSVPVLHRLLRRLTQSARQSRPVRQRRQPRPGRSIAPSIVSSPKCCGVLLRPGWQPLLPVNATLCSASGPTRLPSAAALPPQTRTGRWIRPSLLLRAPMWRALRASLLVATRRSARLARRRGNMLRRHRLASASARAMVVPSMSAAVARCVLSSRPDPPVLVCSSSFRSHYHCPRTESPLFSAPFPAPLSHHARFRPLPFSSPRINLQHLCPSPSVSIYLSQYRHIVHRACI